MPEILDDLLLFSYLIGDRTIVNSKTSKEYTIIKEEKLYLMSSSNIRRKVDNIRVNEELYKLYGRINMRHDKFGKLNWLEKINDILGNKLLVEYYDKRVYFTPRANKKALNFWCNKDKKELMKYALGNHKINFRGFEVDVSSQEELNFLYITQAKNNDELISLKEIIKKRQNFGGLSLFEHLNVISQKLYSIPLKAIPQKEIEQLYDKRILIDTLLGKHKMHNGDKFITIKSEDDIYLLQSQYLKLSKNKLFRRLYARVNRRGLIREVAPWKDFINEVLSDTRVIQYIEDKLDYNYLRKVRKI